MKRHHAVVRITHWVNVVALTIMVGSGLRIFNAYPAFARRARRSAAIRSSEQPIPARAHVRRLARRRAQLALRDDVGARRERPRLPRLHLSARRMARSRAAPRHRPRRVGDGASSISPCGRTIRARASTTRCSDSRISRCRSSASMAVVTGIAIWKPVQLAPLTNLLGGYVWARYWHFWAMLLLVVAHGRPRVHGVHRRSVLHSVDDHRQVREESLAGSAQRAAVRPPAADDAIDA